VLIFNGDFRACASYRVTGNAAAMKNKTAPQEGRWGEGGAAGEGASPQIRRNENT
jgi:hypothetical protein